MARVMASCLHLQRHFEKFRSAFADAGVEVFLPKVTGQQLTADEMRAQLPGMTTVIAGDDPMGASAIAALLDTWTPADPPRAYRGR